MSTSIGATVGMGASQTQRAYEFAANLDAWAAQLDDRLTEAYRNIIFIFLMNVVVGGLYSPGTPVNTGFAQNSWVVGIGGVGAFRQSSSPTSAERGQSISVVSIEEGRAMILDISLTDEVHLSSNCVYMARLEDGWSQQAPTGMVWLALNAGQQIAQYVCTEMLS